MGGGGPGGAIWGGEGGAGGVAYQNRGDVPPVHGPLSCLKCWTAVAFTPPSQTQSPHRSCNRGPIRHIVPHGTSRVPVIDQPPAAHFGHPLVGSPATRQPRSVKGFADERGNEHSSRKTK